MEQPKISYATEKKIIDDDDIIMFVCAERTKNPHAATFYAADDSARSPSENRQSNDVNKYPSSIRPIQNPSAPAAHSHSLNRKNRHWRKWEKKSKLFLFACRSFYLSMPCEYFNHMRMVWTMCERFCKCGVCNRRRPENRLEEKKTIKFYIHFEFLDSVVGKRWCVQRTQFCCCSRCTQLNINSVGFLWASSIYLLVFFTRASAIDFVLAKCQHFFLFISLPYIYFALIFCKIILLVSAIIQLKEFRLCYCCFCCGSSELIFGQSAEKQWRDEINLSIAWLANIPCIRRPRQT